MENYACNHDLIPSQLSCMEKIKDTKKSERLGVEIDRIWIGYSIYHFRIHFQLSEKDTNAYIIGYEKLISVFTKNQLSDTDWIAVNQIQIQIGYVGDGYVYG